MDDFTAEAFGLTQSGVAAGDGAGGHGFSPLFSKGNLSLPAAVNALWTWLNEPFKAPTSPAGITLIVGAILVAVILWNFVLYHIRIAAEAV